MPFMLIPSQPPSRKTIVYPKLPQYKPEYEPDYEDRDQQPDHAHHVIVPIEMPMLSVDLVSDVVVPQPQPQPQPPQPRPRFSDCFLFNCVREAWEVHPNHALIHCQLMLMATIMVVMASIGVEALQPWRLPPHNLTRWSIPIICHSISLLLVNCVIPFILYHISCVRQGACTARYRDSHNLFIILPVYLSMASIVLPLGMLWIPSLGAESLAEYKIHLLAVLFGSASITIVLAPFYYIGNYFASSG